MNKFYNLFIKNHSEEGLQAFIIADDKLTFKKQEKILNDGFKLISDSMLNYEKAEQYANEYYNAHVHSCCLCNQFSKTDFIKGKRWNNAHGKYLVFSGYVCDLCADGLEVSGKVIKSDHYVNNDNIHFPNIHTDYALMDFPELKD